MKKLILAMVVATPLFAHSAEVKPVNCTSEEYSGTIVTQCMDGTTTVVRSTGEIVVCKTGENQAPHCTSFGGDE